MSAPDSMWDSATRARSSTLASFLIRPSSTRPQWPWLVYWQRQTSVMTRRSGMVSFTARAACWTMPSSA